MKQRRFNESVKALRNITKPLQLRTENLWQLTILSRERELSGWKVFVLISAQSCHRFSVEKLACRTKGKAYNETSTLTDYILYCLVIIRHKNNFRLGDSHFTYFRGATEFNISFWKVTDKENFEKVPIKSSVFLLHWNYISNVFLFLCKRIKDI